MSIATKLSKEYRKKIIDYEDVLYVDQAHHLAAKSWSDFKSQFREKKILQFTATPFRNSGKKWMEE